AGARRRHGARAHTVLSIARHRQLTRSPGAAASRGTSFASAERMSDRHRPPRFAIPWIFVIAAAGGLPLSGCATVNSGDYGVALDDTGHPRSAAPNSNEPL